MVNFLKLLKFPSTLVFFFPSVVCFLIIVLSLLRLNLLLLQYIHLWSAVILIDIDAEVVSIYLRQFIIVVVAFVVDIVLQLPYLPPPSISLRHHNYNVLYRRHAVSAVSKLRFSLSMNFLIFQFLVLRIPFAASSPKAKTVFEKV